VDLSLGEHGVVLELGLAERRGVACIMSLDVFSEYCDLSILTSNDDELGLARTESLEDGLVAKGDLTRLHHQRETAVDGVGGSLSLLGGHCDRLCVLMWAGKCSSLGELSMSSVKQYSCDRISTLCGLQ